jgi:osmoprotectant transport system substrate-binding protein
MTISRRRAVALIGASLALPHCAGKNSGNAVRVGSKNFTEAIVVAEIYAQALEAAGMQVERKFNLGSIQIAMAALRRGDIDLYPEYTGTALIDMLHKPPLRDANAVYSTVKAAFAKQFDLVWLDPSPMNDSQGLATTAAISQKYKIRTLSQLSLAAPQLRLGAIPEFLSRADALPGLQKFYGGFHFKDVKTYDIGLKYKALESGAADVVTAFTTDAQIGAAHLVILQDDRHFWPEYHIAPVVRNDALKKFPKIASVLNAVAPKLTDGVVRSLNAAVDIEKQEPADAAGTFMKAQGH